MYPQLVSLILFGIAISYTPGPNNIIASHSGFNFGFKKTLPLILGVAFGWSFVLIFFESGLIILFQKYPILQIIIKGIGTIFLIYLSYKISFARTEETKENKSPITFKDMFFFQFMNPQGILIAMIIVSTFIDPNEMYLRDTLVVTIVMFIMAFTSVSFWCLLGKYLRKFATNEKFIKIFNYSMSFLLIVCVILFYV
jgi:threonine/homoserine/homoserine lactone efflux protein